MFEQVKKSTVMKDTSRASEVIYVEDTSIKPAFQETLTGDESAILIDKTGDNSVMDFARATAAGLSISPRRLESRYLYDAAGSSLFDLITHQPEYYLTRTEAEILAVNSRRIREITGPVTLMELGSGSAVKTD